MPDIVVVSYFLICIGFGACENVTAQSCSIAIGDGVDLPAGAAGSHVLATKNGIRPIYQIDAGVIRAMADEVSHLKERGFNARNVDASYIDRWNRACARVAPEPDAGITILPNGSVVVRNPSALKPGDHFGDGSTSCGGGIAVGAGANAGCQK